MGLFQSLSRLTQGRRSVAAPLVPPPESPDVLAWIEALSGEGRRLEALRYAVPHALRLHSPELWRRISELRAEAVGEAAALSTARPDWPPTTPDIFPGALLPEIDVKALTSQALASALAHHGSLIVRKLFEPSVAAHLRDGIDVALEACAAYQNDPDAPGLGVWHIPFPLPEDAPLADGRRFLRAGGAVWATEAPEVLEDILSLYRAGGVLNAIEGYLGEHPLLSVGKTVLRRAEPAGHGGDFHQDGAFMGADIRTVNVWVALSDCGEDAPGLELVPRRLQGLAETGTQGAFFDWSVGRPIAVEAAGAAGLVKPRFRCGDAILFDQVMLHATYSTPKMDKRRYAVESWFFAPSAYPVEQVAIVI